MAKRRQRSKTARFEIFKRDGFTCQYCGAHPPSVVLVLDHIVPVAGGGSSDDDNLVTACEECNQGKAARSLSQIPQTMSERAAIIAEAESQLRGFNATMKARRDRVERDAWEVAEVLSTRFKSDGIRKDWLRSIKSFNEKLGKYAVIDAMDVACSMRYSERRTFMYFCGICWNQIRAAS